MGFIMYVEIMSLTEMSEDLETYAPTITFMHLFAGFT